MKIAITSDIHLKSDGGHPERLNALKNILFQMLEEGISDLIIAGDLFDIESRNYQVFDALCKDKKHESINFHIIPGNHDSILSQKYFTAQNIRIHNEAGIVTFGNPDTAFFFIPYFAGTTMGEIIAKHRNFLPKRWMLVGHGDYLSGNKSPGEYESGIYMPLGRSDIEYYNPATVFLGHIHKKMQIGKVSYPGSPCGMDINETGKRSFLVLDLNELGVSEKTVETDYIFFSESILALPVAGEFDYFKGQAEKIIKKWELSGKEIDKVRLRLKITGYTSDKKKLSEVIMESFKDFIFYDDTGPDLSRILLFNDPERSSIIERVKNSIEAMEEFDITQQKKDLILEQAQRIILGQ